MNKRLEETAKLVPVACPRIYVTGATASPACLDVNGRKTWVWVIDEFDGDSFLDGQLCKPVEEASSRDELLCDDLLEVAPQKVAGYFQKKLERTQFEDFVRGLRAETEEE